LHVKKTAQPSSSHIPDNHNLNDQPHGPTLCHTPYHPPKMRKSTSPTTLKPPSTNTTTQTPTQLTPWQNHNRFWLHFFVVTTKVTHNTIHSTIQSADPTPTTATTNQHPSIIVNQIQATPTYPSTSHPKTANSIQYPKPQPID